jgi:ferrochelatase
MAEQPENRKSAILLMAYGSPDRLEDVEAYYTDIRGGRKPTAEEVGNLSERYKAIGGSSPLLKITEATARKLETKVGTRVHVGMKHWHPFISETFEQIVEDGTNELLAIALAPHYSKMSIGGYQDLVCRANAQHGDRIKLRFVNDWHRDPVFLEKWRERILNARKEKFSGGGRVYHLFSAHSLPERILSWNDPYRDELLETADALAQRLGVPREEYGFAFQSAGHTAEPWLGPDLLQKLEELGRAGWTEVLSIPVGFVSDHLEILYDIDVEAHELAGRIGIHLERTESFNDSDDFAEVLASVVKENSPATS